VYSPYTNVADGLPKLRRWEAVIGASRLKSKEAREPLLLLELLLLLMNATPQMSSRVRRRQSSSTHSQIGLMLATTIGTPQALPSRCHRPMIRLLPFY
jgi:hypothetical protein